MCKASPRNNPWGSCCFNKFLTVQLPPFPSAESDQAIKTPVIFSAREREQCRGSARDLAGRKQETAGRELSGGRGEVRQAEAVEGLSGRVMAASAG